MTTSPTPSGESHDQAEGLQYAQRLKLLHQTALGILSPQSLYETLQTVVDHVREVLPCQRASISLFGPDGVGTLMAVSADRTQYRAGSKAPINDIDVENLRQGKPNVVQDVTPLVGSSSVYRMLHEEGFAAHVNVPLIAKGQLLGSFNLGRREKNSWTPLEIDIASELGASIAIAIHHKQQEMAAAESQATYRVIFEAVSDGIAIHEVPSGRMIDCNERLCEMVGLPKADYLALWRSSESIVDQTYSLERALSLVRLAAQGEPQLFQWRYITKTGQEIWAEITLRRAVLNGKIRVLAVVRDIAERKANENALRMQRDLVENLLDTAPALIMVLTPDMVIARANRYVQEITGYSLEFLQGKDPLIFLPPEYRARAKELRELILVGQPVEQIELPFLAQGDTVLLVSWNGSPVRDAAGKIVGIMLVGQDMTALRQKEIQVQKMAKMEAVGRLAGGVAHDFNNQLTVIKGYCELLLRGHLPPDMLHSSLDEIYKAASRSATLVSNLLIYSGRQNLRPQIVQLESVLRQMEPSIRAMIGPGIELRLLLPSKARAVSVDIDHMQQAISNLCSNARDAMPSGGVLEIALFDKKDMDGQSMPEASESTTLTGPRVRLTVRDNGHGMAAKTLERVFDPFFTTKQPGKGTGLALAMVHSFVEQSGGSIHADSKPGEGTTFVIDLPAAGQAQAQTT